MPDRHRFDVSNSGTGRNANAATPVTHGVKYSTIRRRRSRPRPCRRDRAPLLLPVHLEGPDSDQNTPGSSERMPGRPSWEAARHASAAQQRAECARRNGDQPDAESERDQCAGCENTKRADGRPATSAEGQMPFLHRQRPPAASNTVNAFPSTILPMRVKAMPTSSKALRFRLLVSGSA